MTSTVPLPDGAAIDDEGVWSQVLRSPAEAGRPALFLDRDGTIIEEVGYIERAEDVALIAGAADVIAKANHRRIPVVIVTNQAGIGRGFFGWDAFVAVQARTLDALAASGAVIDAVYACPYHPLQATYDEPGHPAFKPNPGMVLRAAADLSLDLAASWIIGDRSRDVEAGLNAGLKGGVLVATGYGGQPGERDAALAHASEDFLALAQASIADVPAAVPLFDERD